METPKKPPQKKKHSPEKLAAQKVKEAAHKDLIETLERDIKAVLHLFTTPSEGLVQGQEQLKTKVEQALKDKFGQQVSVESIGLDRLGLPVRLAPLELAVVDHNRDPHSLPNREDTLYHPLALMDALNSSGISTQAYLPPKWIPSKFASRPFALPEPVIVNEAMGLVLVPPDPSHAIRLSLLEDCIQKFPSMRRLLGLLYIFAAYDTDAKLPPLTSRIISHLALAYYSHKYAVPAPTGPSSHPVITSLYCYPFIAPPDVPNTVSSAMEEPVVVSARIPSEFPPSRKSQPTIAYELLELLGWWDGLRWDHHVIMPTSPVPVSRSFDAGPAVKRTWDWTQSPLILQDPVYPLNNLATLLTPTSYSEIRTSFRSIHRGIRAGLGLPLARWEARLLRTSSTLVPATRPYSDTAGKDYGDYLTPDMQDLFEQTRPAQHVLWTRQQTIGRLRSLLERVHGSQYVPVLFGSSRYGVSDSQSDLDIVILDQHRPYGFAPNVPDDSLPSLYKLNDLAASMRKQYDKVLVIPAKVPIIKARDRLSNLHVDININDRLGLFNTELLEHYCRLWPPLSNLIYVIKKWAKVRSLNEPAGLKKGGPTFSSYCLTLMIIGFLQSHRVLPNLHDIPSTASNQEQRPYYWIKVTKTARMKCWIDWHRLPQSQWQPASSPLIGRAFYAWLHYFAYEHKYDEFAIRIADGGIVPRHGRVKKPRTSKKKSPKDQITSDQHPVSADPSDDEELVAGIEVSRITNDIKPGELKAAAEEAKAAQDEDAQLEEALTDGTFIRRSHLEEPSPWISHGLVVGDPFIPTKNCAANISKNSVADFRDKCQRSLEAIDAGIPLRQLLTDGTEYFFYQKATEAEENGNKPRKTPRRRKGKKAKGTQPQVQQFRPPKEITIAPVFSVRSPRVLPTSRSLVRHFDDPLKPDAPPS